MIAKLALQSVRQLVVWTLLVGVIYPAAFLLVGRVCFPRQAGGSLLYRGAELVGSALIAQPFSGAGYFHPRPSAGDYATFPSGASNLGPTSAQLQANVAANLKAVRAEDGLAPNAPVPSDLVFTSASGVDPDISPAAARIQIRRVAAARGLSVAAVTALVDAHVQGRQWGFLGEPRVDVLQLNLALDRLAAAHRNGGRP
jgi:potassium-transporting ATPase KdpC subunit